MLLNRLRKNERRLKSWLKQSGESCYRIYDADLPNYAVAIDLYRGRPDAANSEKTHDLPGLCFLVQEYAAPAQVDKSASERRLKEIIKVIQYGYKVAPGSVFVKQRRRQRGKNQYEKLRGNAEDIVITEGGHQFIVNPDRYLDTGIFLDHRNVRREIANAAKGARFLNLFAYTATATVYAAKAGARSSVLSLIHI